VSFQAKLFVSPSAARRRERALAFLAAQRPSQRLLVAGATLEAAADLLRERAKVQPAGFGWHRQTLQGLASALAAPLLAERGLTSLGGPSQEALCARLLHQEAHRLPSLGPLAALPGTPRALCRTLRSLRLDRVDPSALEGASPELALLLRAYAEQLSAGRFADRALVFGLAAEQAQQGGHELCRLPVLLLDVRLASACDEELVRALAVQAPLCAVAPEGDEALERLEKSLSLAAERDEAAPRDLLSALQRHLFSAKAPPGKLSEEGLVLFSAPGEGRECVEIARRLREEATRGVPFDRMAVLLRSPGQYRAPLEEALARAQLPACFARGSVQPDPAGRAFLALLDCRAEGLSAHAFANYLSLGEVPEARPAAEVAVPLSAAPPGDEPASPALLRAKEKNAPEETAEEDEQALLAAGESLARRSPWRWQRILIDSAVIGGGDAALARARWTRRLAGHQEELEKKKEALSRAGEETTAARTQKVVDELESLRAFAFPLLDRLLALPQSAPWGEWLPQLSQLAVASLRSPARVLSLLAGLEPLGPVGPVTLAEVQQVLSRRLGELQLPPPSRRQGRVFVAPIEAARGMSFEVVFAPGLAERLFPQKLIEDPLLPDAARAQLLGARTGGEVQAARERFGKERVDAERLHLRLAAGAASRTLYASWPRLDLSQQARPRVPSFYALELARAGEGQLPGFDPLQRRASREAQARAAWPAPTDAGRAIDAQEFDLALIDELLARPEEETKGHLRYLLEVNAALARALRQRARRPLRRWTNADGLVQPSAEAKAALAQHSLAARSYSPTALQNYAACPYRFLLSAIFRLEPREEPQPIDALDPMSRGSLLHEVQYTLLTRLQAEELLPIAHALPAERERRRKAAEQALAQALAAVAAQWKDELAPAVERVWDDGVASIEADLRGWLERMAQDERWQPHRFELSFGMADRRSHDRHSVIDPAVLPLGLKLRGSIDLVERSRDGKLRATDHKTGKVRAEPGVVIKGGRVLQPALYALVLEQLEKERAEKELAAREKAAAEGRLLPSAEGAAPVESGRLYYCTHVGGYQDVVVPLDARAREGVKRLADTLGQALGEGFFPVAPAKDECVWCDYRDVCGEDEERRTRHKPREQLAQLEALREEP
jgi:ATP-dependent helicase/nuclease subunit B